MASFYPLNGLPNINLPQNAASIASLVLTTEALVAEKPEKNPPPRTKWLSVVAASIEMQSVKPHALSGHGGSLTLFNALRHCVSSGALQE